MSIHCRNKEIKEMGSISPLSLLCMSFTVIFYVAFFSFFSCSSAQNQLVPALYVFGDSLVDVGNNNYLKLSIYKADFPHNGIDYPGRKATGRFSNGRNAADFLAEKLGLVSVPPYLSISSNSDRSSLMKEGVNFASGGAGILDGSRVASTQYSPLNKQIEYYSQVYGDLVQQSGTVEAQQHLSKSLFAVVIGSNDVFGYFKSDSKAQHNYTPQQFIDLLVLTLKGQLKRIYNLGARKFVVVGLGAIGCCPSQRNQNKTGGCNEEVNYWSVKYNEGLSALLQEMKSELRDMSYSIFNTYNVMLNYISKPALYGFAEVEAACCGLGNLNAKVACLPVSRYCHNRNDHVFWDFYHPTEKAAHMFIDTVFDGQTQDVYPVNVRQLVAM